MKNRRSALNSTELWNPLTAKWFITQNRELICLEKPFYYINRDRLSIEINKLDTSTTNKGTIDVWTLWCTELLSKTLTFSSGQTVQPINEGSILLESPFHWLSTKVYTKCPKWARYSVFKERMHQRTKEILVNFEASSGQTIQSINARGILLKIPFHQLSIDVKSCA